MCSLLAASSNGWLESALAQPNEKLRTFVLGHIIEMALERNPTIAGAEGVIQLKEGTQGIAGAYPNSMIILQSADAALIILNHPSLSSVKL